MKEKYLTSFKLVGSFITSQQTNINPGFVLATGIQGLSLVPVNMLKIEHIWNLLDGKTSSTSSKYFKSLERATKGCAFFKAKFQTKVSNLLQEHQLRNGDFKNNSFNYLKEKICS